MLHNTTIVGGKLCLTYKNACFILKHAAKFAKNKFCKKIMDSRSGEQASIQIGKIGEIKGLENGDFSLPDGQCFNLKNDGVSAVELTVQLAGMEEGDFVTTRFDVGWNPEIIKVVRQTSQPSGSLKWGY